MEKSLGIAQDRIDIRNSGIIPPAFLAYHHYLWGLYHEAAGEKQKALDQLRRAKGSLESSSQHPYGLIEAHIARLSDDKQEKDRSLAAAKQFLAISLMSSTCTERMAALRRELGAPEFSQVVAATVQDARLRLLIVENVEWEWPA